MMPVNVAIDEHFARFGERSFAVSKINSVAVRERRTQGALGAVLFSALGLIWLIFAIGAKEGAVFSILAVLAVFSFGGGLWAWRLRHASDFQLFLTTSSSEVQAFVSKDRREVEALRDALEKAIREA